MKHNILILILVVAFGSTAAADVMQDFDGLGDNRELFDKAKALHPEMEVTVVQKRVVDRRNRLETAFEAASYLGGDSYADTYGYGINLHYHITPRWSIGAKYTYFTNQLSKEGSYLINDTTGSGQGQVPAIDYPKSNIMGMLNVYPFYGKLNVFGNVTHFDIYGFLGGGTITLESGGTPVYTAGGGVGLWWSQHLTTRAEARYQTYEAQRYTGPADIENTVISLQVGYLL